MATPAFLAVSTSTIESPTSIVDAGPAPASAINRWSPRGSGLRGTSPSPPMTFMNSEVQPKAATSLLRGHQGLVGKHRKGGQRRHVGQHFTDTGIGFRRGQQPRPVDRMKAAQGVVKGRAVGIEAGSSERTPHQNPRTLAHHHHDLVRWQRRGAQ